MSNQRNHKRKASHPALNDTWRRKGREKRQIETLSISLSLPQTDPSISRCFRIAHLANQSVGFFSFAPGFEKMKAENGRQRYAAAKSNPWASMTQIDACLPPGSLSNRFPDDISSVVASFFLPFSLSSGSLRFEAKNKQFFHLLSSLSKHVVHMHREHVIQHSMCWLASWLLCNSSYKEERIWEKWLVHWLTDWVAETIVKVDQGTRLALKFQAKSAILFTDD